MSVRGEITDQALIDEICSSPWWHSIDLGNGLITPGGNSLESLTAMANVIFSESVEGKSVIDIGCWDGFFSIEAARRGATSVLATDDYVWRMEFTKRRNAEIAARLAAPSVVKVKQIDVFDISHETVGMHDVVLFFGVLYHMRHPLLAMEKAASVCSEILIVETQLDAVNEERPAMIFYPGIELANDPSNWWGPNIPCVEAMLRDQGFPWIRYTQRPAMPDRGIFHARRTNLGILDDPRWRETAGGHEKKPSSYRDGLKNLLGWRRKRKTQAVA
jgi:tRNA (mo5U34)-methyltransferase